MVDAAFAAFLMSLCNKSFSATQFALLSSASTLIGRLISAGSGWLATALGWPLFFALTIGAVLPSLILLLVAFPKNAGGHDRLARERGQRVRSMSAWLTSPGRALLRLIALVKSQGDAFGVAPRETSGTMTAS